MVGLYSVEDGRFERGGGEEYYGGADLEDLDAGWEFV